MLKTFREIRDTIGSFISIVIIIFIGCFFFAGIVAASTAVTNQVDDYYNAQKLADARGEYMFVNSAAVDEIAADERVTLARGYDTFYTKTNYKGIRFDMTLTTLTDGIDEPLILSGRLPEHGKQEIIVDTVFAEKYDLSVADKAKLTFNISTLKSIKLAVDGGAVKYTPEYEQVAYTFTVVGIYHSPDTIYKVNMMNTSARPEEFISALINYGIIDAFTADAQIEAGIFKFPVPRPEGIDVFTGIKIIGDVKDPAELFSEYSVSDEEGLRKMLQDDPSAPGGLYMYTLEQSSYPSVAAFNNINGAIASLAAVLPFMFFAVAAAITIISLSKTVDNQRMQIGVIQALGISKGAVYFSYIFYALFACVIGGFAGGIVGTYTVPHLLAYLYNMQFSMPPMPMHIDILFLFLGVIISAGLACISAFISCHHTLRVVPAQAMRPKPPKKTKRILAERWTWLWKRLGFGAKMNLRNMFLHKVRMLLSSVGIVGCLALLIGLIGLKDNMAYSFESYDDMVGYDMTVITDIAVDLTNEEVYKGIDGADGEQYMHHLTFVPEFSGKIKVNGKSADTSIMALPTYADEKHYRYADADCIKLYTDLERNDRVLFKSDTFVIHQTLASELGVQAGDTVTVSGYSLDNKAVEFNIKVTAVVYEYFEQKAYCAYDVFKNNGVALLATTSYATLLPGVDADDAIVTLKNNDAVRDVKTFRESFLALEKQMSLLDYAVVLFVIGAAALAIAVIYNITATNLKERTREIATLMVLGYKRGETAGMIMVENLVITGIGCTLGYPLGYGLLVWLVNLTVSFKVFISSFLSWYVALGCVALTFVFSLIATLLLNTRMKKISMVEALKSVE